MGYAAVEDQGVHDLVARANAARLDGVRDAGSEAAETLCRDLFGAHRRLAVYGPFAPGEARHYMLAPLRGAWRTGFVRGRLERRAGFEALRLDGAARAPVHLLSAPALEAIWPVFEPLRLAGLRRLLAAVEDDDGVCAVATLMALG